MNKKEYKIIEAGTAKLLQILVNASFTQEGKIVTLVGGVFAEVYPNFPPRFYQTILIEPDMFKEAFDIHQDNITCIPSIWTKPTPTTTVYTLTGGNAYDSVMFDEKSKIEAIEKKYKKKDKNKS